jgi:uncharacterized protein YegJ (DUF2314 family)
LIVDPVQMLILVVTRYWPRHSAWRTRSSPAHAAADADADADADALEAASLRARAQLPTLRVLFNEGLSLGEFLLFKAPFDGPDKVREWMWVTVDTWDGDKITGSLFSEPCNIPTLYGGQTVEISQSTVFDYLYKRTDGTTDGNETEKLIASSS